MLFYLIVLTSTNKRINKTKSNKTFTILIPTTIRKKNKLSDQYAFINNQRKKHDGSVIGLGLVQIK